MLVQGTGFNWATPDHFRIVFLPHEEDLREAVGRIAGFLERYRNRAPEPLCSEDESNETHPSWPARHRHRR